LQTYGTDKKHSGGGIVVTWTFSGNVAAVVGICPGAGFHLRFVQYRAVALIAGRKNNPFGYKHTTRSEMSGHSFGFSCKYLLPVA
jgi:hypothetical protein